MALTFALYHCPQVESEKERTFQSNSILHITQLNRQLSKSDSLHFPQGTEHVQSGIQYILIIKLNIRKVNNFNISIVFHLSNVLFVVFACVLSYLEFFTPISLCVFNILGEFLVHFSAFHSFLFSILFQTLDPIPTLLHCLWNMSPLQ